MIENSSRFACSISIGGFLVFSILITVKLIDLNLVLNTSYPAETSLVLLEKLIFVVILFLKINNSQNNDGFTRYYLVFICTGNKKDKFKIFNYYDILFVCTSGGCEFCG